MTSLQLHLPSDVLAVLREEDGPGVGARGVSLTVSIDGLDVVSGVSSTTELKEQLPTLAQAICLCVFRRPPSAVTRLVVDGPGLQTRVTLPPDVSPHQVLTTLAGLVDTVERAERAERRRAEQAAADRDALDRAVAHAAGVTARPVRAVSSPVQVIRTPAQRTPHQD